MCDGLLDKFSLMSTVSDRISSLFNSEDLSDVTFLVGTEGNYWRYPGHKFILSLASPVFRTMFASSLSEGKAEAQVTITDVQPSAFESVLQYIYTNQPNISCVRIALDTLYAAHKYMLYNLAMVCMEFLASHVDRENVLEIYAEVKLYDIELNKGKLMLKCLQTIDREASEILKSQAFGNLDFSTLKMILKREFLQITSELEVFNGIAYWAVQECRRRKLELNAENKRLVLGKALCLVQYLTLSREDFLQGPAASGLLTEEECHALLGKIYGDDKMILPSQLSRHYLKWKRAIYHCYPVKFFRKEPNTVISSSQEETIIIATNQDITLLGFDLYGVSSADDKFYSNGLHLKVLDMFGNVMSNVQWKTGQEIPIKDNKLFIEFLAAVFLKSRKKYKVELFLPKGEYLMGENWEGTTTSKYKCRSIDFAVKYCKKRMRTNGDSSDDDSFAELGNSSEEEQVQGSKSPSAVSEPSVPNVPQDLNSDPEVFVRSHFHGVKFYF